MLLTHFTDTIIIAPEYICHYYEQRHDRKYVYQSVYDIFIVDLLNAFRGETAELATTEITCHMASLQNLSIQSARHAKPFCSVRSLPCGMK